MVADSDVISYQKAVLYGARGAALAARGAQRTSPAQRSARGMRTHKQSGGDAPVAAGTRNRSEVQAARAAQTRSVGSSTDRVAKRCRE
eukprot:2827309-Pleurochrysis_carterae.AAC.1